MWRQDFSKTFGYSVRCVKDQEQACPGTPTVTYEGQTYNTVQIGDQCWFKENLNVGTMIPGIQEMTNNSIIEKYCYDNDPANCSTYGGLYQWNEMMQYTTQQGVQGICPVGWHLPTEEEVAIVSDFLGGNLVAGGKMKETGTLHWLPPNTGATNESGFTGLPGGVGDEGGYFSMGLIASLWASTEINTSGSRSWGLSYAYTGVSIGYSFKSEGQSVRCVKDADQSCPGTPTVTYEGQTYNTVQIGDQCWLRENLNVGSMIPGTQDMADNSIMEKYCYNNEPDSCTKYGGLYQWNEMMQYTTVQGTQGICPNGWHIPTDGEWCTVTQFIDPTVDCNSITWNGTDAGTKMKSTTSWNPGSSNTNSSGFTALAGGYRAIYGNFTWQGSMAVFSTSTVSPPSYAWLRMYGSNYSQVNRGFDDIDFGFSVRCLKNY